MFKKVFQSEANKTLTENGDLAYKSTGTSVIDMFGKIGSLRGGYRSDDDINNEAIELFINNDELTHNDKPEVKAHCKKLAYEVKKNKEGTYLFFNFEAKPDSIIELERVYRITDEVIKFIVVKKEN